MSGYTPWRGQHHLAVDQGAAPEPRALVDAFLAHLDQLGPVARLVAYTALLDQRIPTARRRAVGELVAQGWTQTRIADAAGMKRAAVSHLVPKK